MRYKTPSVSDRNETKLIPTMEGTYFVGSCSSKVQKLLLLLFFFPPRVCGNMVRNLVLSISWLHPQAIAERRQKKWLTVMLASQPFCLATQHSGSFLASKSEGKKRIWLCC